jgi:hypothetical protein
MMRAAIGACIAWAVCVPSIARSIEPVMTSPAATIGGVIAIPMRGEAGERWPSRMRIERLDGGAPIEGMLAWIASAPPSLDRGWTSADERLDVRPISKAPAGVAGDAAGVVVLLAQLPPDLRGSLRVAGTRIEPAWLPLAEPLPDATRPMLAPGDTPMLDRPDPSAPAEWFRWWLLADEASCRPPEPQGDRESTLYALHRAQLWQAGLDRVERASPGVAREIRECLTATCVDRRGDRSLRIAAWMARADELASLLSILLDATRTDEQVMESALARIRERVPVTAWIEADAGTSLRLAIANPAPESVTLRVTWAESRFLAPVQIQVPAGGVARSTIDRPSELMPDPLTRNSAPAGGTMIITGPKWETRLPVAPARIVPRPPGYAFGVLRPPLSLADAQRLRIAPPPPEWMTTASLRRRFGRWEVFAECLRPESTDLDELEVVVGGEGLGAARIRIREAGDPIVEGAPQIEVPRVQRGSFADRWRCVIELPGSWTPAQGAMMLGVARAPAGAGTRQTGALAVPDWMPMPVISLDPAGWWSGTVPPAMPAASVVEPPASAEPAAAPEVPVSPPAARPETPIRQAPARTFGPQA